MEHENNNGLALVSQPNQEPDAASDQLERAVRFLTHELTVDDTEVHCSLNMAMRFAAAESVPHGEKESANDASCEL